MQFFCNLKSAERLERIEFDLSAFLFDLSDFYCLCGNLYCLYSGSVLNRMILHFIPYKIVFFDFWGFYFARVISITKPLKDLPCGFIERMAESTERMKG
nr:MAG TPA: hypothetical protein [Caudoviricetes sp.]